MKNFQRKLMWGGFVAYMSVPALSYAAPGQLADQPLWLGTSVKHNLMFAIDDSGSMDWELSFDIKDGTPRLNGAGNFINSSGNLNTSGSQYAYVFANGAATPYDGRRLYTGRYAIPPIPQYASARSAAYNNAYYDPNVEYKPWPDFRQYTDDIFGDASLTATKVEPVSSEFGTRTVNLFADLDTSTKGNYWEYDVRDGDMVCRADGSTCGTGRKEYVYYPATYYMKDTTSTYYYHADAYSNLASGGSTLSSATSTRFEAESPDRTGGSFMASSPVLVAATSGGERTDLVDAQSDASGSDFVGSVRGSAGIQSNPTVSNFEYDITLPAGMTGNVNIWIRNMGFSSSTDSIWGKLDGFGSGSVNIANPSSTGWNGQYGPMRDNVSTNGSWTWTKWGDVNLTGGSSYTFELAYRETGFLVDQVLFTTESDTPVGSNPITTPTPVSTLGVARSCASDTTVAQYLEFARNPERFRTQAVFVDNEDHIVDGFGFDGACLTKYEVGKTGADSDNFVNGAGITRTVLEEKQNFANWFKYYRRRHQAMRGGLASSLQGINGIKTGMFWLNNRRTVGAAQMNDMSTDAGVATFLSDHYKRVYNSGTPLRSALYHALSQYKSSTGPVTSECQKNYTLLFTDGFNTQTSFSSVGNTDGVAGEPYQDTYSGSLADIAYKGYTENLKATLPEGQVRVGDACNEASPDAWLDCNKNPHMNTYTVGLGLTGNIFGNTHNTKQDAYSVPPTWPNVGSQGLAQIDDLYHAAVNGRGEMFSAQSPALLATALRSAIDDIVESIGSGSGVTFNSSSLQSQDGTAIYTTLFNSANWSGDLEGKLLDSNTGDVLDLVWQNAAGDGVGAAAILDERNLALDPRVMLTKDPSADGVGFVWDDLTNDQRNDLRTEPLDSNGIPTGSDEMAQKRLAFFRGDRANEGLLFRQRGSLMADVIHSAPVYIGNPASNWPDEGVFGTSANRYSDFKDETLANGGASDRTPALYVGANGGMLHGFNAKNSGSGAGREVMAYVPNLIYSTASAEGLHYLTDPNYSHRYYVDLTPVAQDVFTTVNGTGTKDWRTMLVGGLRGGGKGLFALDVTNPDAYSEADSGTVGTGKVAASDTVMWEFTEADDANLGFLTSPPVISMLNNNKWAVMFGNGYESVNGKAALMILFVEGGLDGSWSITDKRVISTGIGTSGDKNGLSGITAVDMDRDSIPDLVYAGDIKGNLWAFDITDSDSANWKVAYQNSGAPEELFTAVNADGNIQPITAAPIVSLNTETNTAGYSPNVLVSFGTGQYLVDGDQANTQVQSFYTIWDKGVSNLDRSDLALRSMTENAQGIRSVSGSAVNWASDLGWAIDFDVSSSPGERVIQKPTQLFDSVNGPIALFNSMIPNSSECSGGGESVLYAIPVLSGMNPTKPILDLDGDGSFDSSDLGAGKRESEFNNEANVLGKNIYSANKDQSGNGTGIDKESHNASIDSDREGRLGWNEMLDE